MPSDCDLYNVLGVARNASPDDIKKAFRKKAVLCHPDKHPGDAAKEDEFKKINEAYMVLSDTEKRKRYDLFGEVDDMPQGGPNMADMSDIFSGLFGHSRNGGGFSFSFSDDGGMGMPPHIFERMFGRGAPPHMMKKQADVIEIPVDICDLYYGRTRKVEFEISDVCSKCNGVGASDPSAIIKCMTCDGIGHITQQMGPFLIQGGRCPNCGGQGTSIRANKACVQCKGQRTHFVKKSFELKIPSGIPNHFEVRMDGKGSYDDRAKQNKDMVFKFIHNIAAPYKLEQRPDGLVNVHMDVLLTIEDLLAGCEKNIKVYSDDYTIVCDTYFNPSRPFVVEGKGLPSMEDSNKHGDLVIKFGIEFTDNEKLKKHNQLIRKMLKRAPKQEDGESQTMSPHVIKVS